jgi:hypothetical protein
MILTVLLALLRLAAKLYSKSPLRVHQLRKSQEKMLAPQYNLQKPATTRWIAYADPNARLNEQYTSVVDHTATAGVDKNNNADTRLACQNLLSALTDLTTFLTMLATLPFMRTLKTLILQLQSNTLYVGDFARAIESAGSHLRERYTNSDTAWSGSAFAEWIAVKRPAKQPHKPGSKLYNRLLLAKHVGTPVVHLQDEAGEATLMAATPLMLGMEAASDSAAGMQRLPVDAAAYKELRKEVQKQVSSHGQECKEGDAQTLPLPRHTARILLHRPALLLLRGGVCA